VESEKILKLYYALALHTWQFLLCYT